MPADGWPTLPGAPAAYTIQLDARGQVGDAKGGEGFHKFTNEQMEARMAAAEASGHVRYAYPRPATPRAAGGVKIFGLVAVRNVADNIALFLELLANVTGRRRRCARRVGRRLTCACLCPSFLALLADAIAVLDDASTDDTVAAVLAAAARGINVELLVTKREWLVRRAASALSVCADVGARGAAQRGAGQEPAAARDAATRRHGVHRGAARRGGG